MPATISITATGFSIGGPLVAGEPVSVSVSGVELAEGAALSLAMTARFPDALLASCDLAESEETPGTWTGTLDSCTKQAAFYFQTARADEARPVALELVDTAHRESIARISAPLVNSSLLPPPWGDGKNASPVLLPVPGPQGEAATISVGTTTTLAAGSSATVKNVGTESAAVLNFGIPQGASGGALPYREITTASDSVEIESGSFTAIMADRSFYFSGFSGATPPAGTKVLTYAGIVNTSGGTINVTFGSFDAKLSIPSGRVGTAILFTPGEGLVHPFLLALLPH